MCVHSNWPLWDQVLLFPPSINPPKPNSMPLSIPKNQLQLIFASLFISLASVSCSGKWPVTDSLGHTQVWHWPQKYFVN